MTQQIQDRLAKLKARLRSREGKPGLEENCIAIKQEIERLENLHLTTSKDDREMSSGPSVASKDKSGE